MSERTPQLGGLTPILYVSSFQTSMDYYTQKLGFTKKWQWGDPPDFGCVERDEVEIFLCHGAQGQPGTWMSVFVRDVDDLYEELTASGANIPAPPEDKPWGMREFLVVDPDGHTLRMGTGKPERDMRIERVPVDATIEKRLALVLNDLAKRTNRTVGEVLEETLLHTFEPVPGRVGEAVASPHGKLIFDLIDELKKQHGLDYETHDAYRFTED